MTKFASMTPLVPTADKAAVSLSALCVLHCLALPIALTLFPPLAAFGLQEEWAHKFLLVSVIPISLYALTLGCRQHRSVWVAAAGFLGVLFLVAAATVGHRFFGEGSETLLTLVGAILVAVSHVLNFRLCRASGDCRCAAAIE